MQIFRQLKARMDEVSRYINEKPYEQETDEKPESVKKSKASSLKIAPYIKASEYGRVKFIFKDDHFILESPVPNKVRNETWAWGDKGYQGLRIEDFRSNVMIVGESGSGKTAFVYNQALENVYFKPTHLAPEEGRDEKKFGMVCMEAKGDFPDKVWRLAQKYGRTEDCVFFGPDHNTVYDPFADPTEMPIQLADKLQKFCEALNGGSKSQDPFWPEASKKMFLNIFWLQRKLREIDPENTPYMTFSLLYQVMSDDGNPVNMDVIRAHEKSLGEMIDNLKIGAREAFVICNEVSLHLDSFIYLLDAHYKNVQLSVEVLQDEEMALTVGDIDSEAAKTALGIFAGKKSELNRQRTAVGKTKMLLDGCATDDEVKMRLTQIIEETKRKLLEFRGTTDSDKMGKVMLWISETAINIETLFNETMPKLIELPLATTEIRTALSQYLDQMLLLRSFWEGICAADTGKPQPVIGALKKMLNDYVSIIEENGVTIKEDPVCNYFFTEHFNMENQKTIGSVRMVASNSVNNFVHKPFDKLFGRDASFNFAEVIDKGKLFVLDMPMAKYGVAAEVCMLLFKMDFFRACLSREGIYVAEKDDEGNITEEPRLVNQVRELCYMCDEFGSIVTTGNTGEAYFMDKNRQYKCACWVGFQLLDSLRKKVTREETNGIMGVCAVRFLLRTKDDDTQKFASTLSGQELKVGISFNKGFVDHAMNNKDFGGQTSSNSITRGNRFNPTDFGYLRDGECVLVLNPRFGKNAVVKVDLKLHVDLGDGKLPLPRKITLS